MAEHDPQQVQEPSKPQQEILQDIEQKFQDDNREVVQQEPDYFDLQKYARWMYEEWIAPHWGTDDRNATMRIFHDLQRELELAEKFKLVVINEYLQQHWPRGEDHYALWLFRYVEAMMRYNRTCIRALGGISEKLEGRCDDAWEDLALCLTIGESVLHTAVKDINETVGYYRPLDLDYCLDPSRLHVIVCGIEEVEAALNKVCMKASDVCYEILKKECLE